MPFYHLLIEGSGLHIPDGPIGFTANRFVYARTPDEAEKLIRHRTKGDWTTGLYAGLSPGSPPKVEVLERRRVSISMFLRNWRQNRAHVFYEIDD